MAKKLFEGMSFDALCKKYLKEGADIAALSEEGAAPVEGGVEECDAEMDAPADEFGAEEGLEGEGDVTITLSADLVAALRSILALVDGEGVAEEAETEDELEAEDDVVPADETETVEDEIEPDFEEEGVFEEDEETVLGDGQGATAATLSSTTSAPARKKGTPAVDRKMTVAGAKAKPGKKILDIQR